MSVKVQFRASKAGACLREIVQAKLDPDSVRPPEDKLLFLKMGHWIQAGVVEWLQRYADPGLWFPKYEPSEPEEEGLIEGKKFVLTGHPDNFLGIQEDVLEVKAIMAKSFEELRGLADWREKYPSYRAQVQCYMHMFGAGTGRFIFINRDTSEVMGGVPLEAPDYTFRPDMVEEEDISYLDEVLAKHERAASYVKKGKLPRKCSPSSGLCWFCRTFPRKKKPKVGYIEETDLLRVLPAFGANPHLSRLEVKVGEDTSIFINRKDVR